MDMTLLHSCAFTRYSNSYVRSLGSSYWSVSRSTCWTAGRYPANAVQAPILHKTRTHAFVVSLAVSLSPTLSPRVARKVSLGIDTHRYANAI